MEAFPACGWAAAYAAVGVDEVRRVVCGVALLAYVAVLVLGSAFGAGALHVPVREEPFTVLAVRELYLLGVDVAVLPQPPEDELCVPLILRAVRGVVAVEPDEVVVVVPLVLPPPALDELLGGDPLLRGVDLYGRTVGVVGPTVDHVVPSQLHEADPDVRLYVLHHVAYVHGAVGVDKRRCY